MRRYLKRRRLRQKGTRLEVAGQVAEAVAVYRSMLDGSRRDMDVYHDLVSCFTRAGLIEEAAETAREGLDCRSDDFEFLVLVGQHAERRGDAISAFRYAQRAAVTEAPLTSEGVWPPPRFISAIFERYGQWIGIDVLGSATRIIENRDRRLLSQVDWVEKKIDDDSFAS